MRTLLLLLSTIVCLSIGSASATESQRDQLLRLINQERAKTGLKALQTDPRLQTTAEEWAERLAASGRMTHRSRRELGEMQRAWGLSYINENLYRADHQAAASRVVQAWMNSPGHRRNLLHPDASLAGIAAASRPDGGLFVVFHAATPFE